MPLTSTPSELSLGPEKASSGDLMPLTLQPIETLGHSGAVQVICPVVGDLAVRPFGDKPEVTTTVVEEGSRR